MQSFFWSNSIWYIILGILSIIEMIIVMVKTKNKKLLTALFFTISGMAFSIEATIMFFLKSYRYFPMLMPQLPKDDMIIGNFFSQFSVTSTVLLITVLNKKYLWYFIFAGVYSLIEELFIMLGIFSHNWYQTWMTFIGFVILCWITKKIYISSLIKVRPVLLYIYVFFAFFNLYLITLLWIFKVSGVIDFNMGILPDAMISYNLLALINMFVITIPCIIIYFTRLKWRWKAVVLVALYITILIEYKMRLILIKQGWSLIYPTIEILGTYMYVYMLDKLYTSKKSYQAMKP